jgi:hypothetical protein
LGLHALYAISSTIVMAYSVCSHVFPLVFLGPQAFLANNSPSCISDAVHCASFLTGQMSNVICYMSKILRQLSDPLSGPCPLRVHNQAGGTTQIFHSPLSFHPHPPSQSSDFFPRRLHCYPIATPFEWPGPNFHLNSRLAFEGCD